MEWLQSGTYTFETQHPPLGRIAAALGPFLVRARIRCRVVPGTALVQWEGTQILYHNHQYDLTLAPARLGILAFFWIACLAVYAWARRYHGAVVGVTALFLFSFSPPILAHSGLATTDVPVAALVCASFYSALVSTEALTPRQAGTNRRRFRPRLGAGYQAAGPPLRAGWEKANRHGAVMARNPMREKIDMPDAGRDKKRRE